MRSSYGSSPIVERRAWVDGVVHAMSRGGPEHARLTNRVTGRVLTPLLDEGCEEQVDGDGPLIAIEL